MAWYSAPSKSNSYSVGSAVRVMSREMENGSAPFIPATNSTFSLPRSPTPETAPIRLPGESHTREDPPSYWTGIAKRPHRNHRLLQEAHRQTGGTGPVLPGQSVDVVTELIASPM